MQKDKILILGGTNFIGRNLVEKLLESNEYELTLFNRGQTNKGLFPEILHILGDRQTKDIEKISHEDWEYIIDLSCFYPDDLEQTIKHLKTPPKKYILISTCSVYDNEAYQGILRDESAPILDCTKEQASDTSLNTYGHRKAACEKVLVSSGIEHTILRPALVYGRYDSTDRFYYWLHQVKKYDLLLIPESGIRKFSVTYVHDLVAAIITSLQTTTPHKIFNVISTNQTSIIQIIQEAQKLLKGEYKIRNAPFQFLEENNIEQWFGIPLWLHADYFTYENSKLINNLGITPTPIGKSIAETIDFFDKQDWPNPVSGISDERKNKLIKKLTPL